MIIIIMFVFIVRLFMSVMLNCADQVQVQDIKHMHLRRPKPHVSEQSCSNIQPSSKDGSNVLCLMQSYFCAARHQ